MSTENQKVNIEVYKPNSTIEVKLPSIYVQRFNQLLLEFMPFKDEAHFNQVLQNVADNKIEGPFEYHLETVLSFLTLVEDAARQQNLLDTVEVDPVKLKEESNED
jgi:hypothetical protein